MSRRTGRLARALSGVAVVLVLGGVTVAGSIDEVSAASGTPGSVVGVPPTATTLVCPGPLVLPADTPAGGDAFDPTPVDTLTAQRVATTAPGDAATAPPATLSPLAGGAPLLDLSAAVPAQVGSVPDVDGPTVLQAEPAGDVAAPAGGASASVTTEGDLRGVAAASCQQPSASIWLVGGSTEIGSSGLLVVTNPGRTPAEVSLEVWGPAGPVDVVGGGTFLVAPGAERGVLLEGIAAEQRRVVVHVTAAGGLVTAHLQDNRLVGFTPAGTDLVTAGAPPGTRQVVGGVVVPATETGATDTALVRLLAPADEPARASLTLLGPDGPVTLAGAERVDLIPGEVTDVSLAGLPAGSYTAVVESDTPVVAGAMVTRQGPPIELDVVPTLERAWVASGATGAAGVVAVPPAITATVVVGAVAPQGTDADGAGTAGGVLRAFGADGALLAEQRLSVPAGSTLRIDGAALGGGQEVAAIELLPDDPGPAVPAGADGGPSGVTDEAATDDTATEDTITDDSTTADRDAGAADGDPTDGTADPAVDGAPALAWWVLATSGSGPDELLSVLTPVAGPQETPSVRVLRGERLGLP